MKYIYELKIEEVKDEVIATEIRVFSTQKMAENYVEENWGVNRWTINMLFPWPSQWCIFTKNFKFTITKLPIDKKD
jgi:hypothetical protein